MKIVRIATAGRRKIDGTLIEPHGSPPPPPAALFLHGWGSDRRRHLIPAERLSEIGFVSLAIDLRGHGRTESLGPSVSALDNLRDASAAYDFLASRRNVDQNRMLVAGFSYGGFLATLLASERKLRWLALRSPALYRDQDLEVPKAEIKRRGLMAFRRRLLTPAHCMGLRSAAAVRANVLLIEAERDRVIPHQEVRNYLNAFRRARSLTHKVIRGADHAMSREEWFGAAVGVFLDWVGHHSRRF